MEQTVPEDTGWFNPGGPTKIGEMPLEAFQGYMAGRRDGFAEGVQEGRRQLEQEQEAALTAATSRVIHSVVHDLNYPEHAANRKAVEQRRAAASEAYWADRRAGRKEDAA